MQHKSQERPSARALEEYPDEPLEIVFAGNERRWRMLIPQINPRLSLLAIGMLALLAAMWGGVVRMGWELPPILQILPAIHGPLIITGFLGTLISLERAVALQQRWTFAAPLLCALSAVILTANISPSTGAFFATLGSIGLLVIFGVIVRQHRALFTITMALGVVVWAIGNLLWLAGLPIARVVNWWTGFLILTILGERLELARIQRLSQNSTALYAAAIGMFLVGLAVDAVEAFALGAASDVGARLTGAGMFAMALWLARYDIARRTVRQEGLTRFIAVCLLTGYFWLGVGGVLRFVSGGITAGLLYDAMLHAVFLGFVMSMIFGHAPIILPAVLGRAIPYRVTFYAHLALLHASLALRVLGDLSGALELRQWGGMLNMIAVLLFLFQTMSSVARGARAAK